MIADRKTPQTDEFCRTPFKADTELGMVNEWIDFSRRLERERDAAVEALNRIASWGEGSEVDSSFDEPASASEARATLRAIEESKRG